jgi:branched-chain amino acid aminotransferase
VNDRLSASGDDDDGQSNREQLRVKKEAYGDYIAVDHVIRPATAADLFDRIPELAIYEVIQIKEGIPLFFPEHINRMRSSARLMGKEIAISEPAILRDIRDLVLQNRCDHIHVKILVAQVAGQQRCVSYFIPLEPREPGGLHGVHTTLFSGERDNPHIKTLKGSFRDRVRDARRKTGAYEALLTDGGGYITEGTRSNIFFLGEADTLITPPTGKVLKGVTRDKVMRICRARSISVMEKAVHTGDLTGFRGAFLTGTTVDVSPVGSIDARRYASGTCPEIRLILEGYDKMVAECIHENRNLLRDLN